MLLATAAEAWAVDDDAAPLVGALAALGIRGAPGVWDDPEVAWEEAALVVVRSTWDYARRREEFLVWADAVSETTTLLNPAPVLRWNTDKTYLRDLAGAGVPVVPTRFLSADLAEDARRDALAAASTWCRRQGAAEMVVKPSVSAGSKDTGRFPGDGADAAGPLVARIAASGRTTMVQPYLASVDERGETGLVFFDGRLSHGFSKAALLRPGGETARGLFAVERIEPRRADDDERDVAEAVVAEVERRFGVPLYARVDLVRDDDGTPRLLELELTEPSWFLSTDPGAAGRAAAAVAAHLG